MLKKSSIIIALAMSVILAVLIPFGAFSKAHKNISYGKVNAADSAAAENVIREHFRWRNEKNTDGVNSTVTKGNRHILWQFDNQDYIRIIDIKEDLVGNVKQGYMYSGNGRFTNPKGVKVFYVEYEIKLKDIGGGPISNGRHISYYVVIKQNNNSPWLIDSWGP